MGNIKWEKANKKKLFREHYNPDVFFSKTLRTFILANSDKILENSEN